MSLAHTFRAKRDAMIVAGYQHGLRMAVLAHHHGLSERHVGRIVKAAGAQKTPQFLPGRKPGRNRSMAEAYLAGDTLQAIGDRHGIAPATVWQTVRRLGVLLSKEEVSRRRAGKGRKRLEISETDRPLYEKMRHAFGAAYAREQMGIAA